MLIIYNLHFHLHPLAINELLQRVRQLLSAGLVRCSASSGGVASIAASDGSVGTMNYYYILQITEKLLEAEEKKLRVLKAEIEASKRIDAAKDTSKVLIAFVEDEFDDDNLLQAMELEQQEANYV